jgi:hypothetical protein
MRQNILSHSRSTPNTNLRLNNIQNSSSNKKISGNYNSKSKQKGKVIEYL